MGIRSTPIIVTNNYEQLWSTKAEIKTNVNNYVFFYHINKSDPENIIHWATGQVREKMGEKTLVWMMERDSKNIFTYKRGSRGGLMKLEIHNAAIFYCISSNWELKMLTEQKNM